MRNQYPPLDLSYMKTALQLSKKSKPSPNPRVGAVIVKAGEIIGQGYHERPGTPHAEINALNDAGDSARGADLYVTLEPCCHHGKTGPCGEALVTAGVSRVIVGMVDPDPRVQGKGIAYLKDNGIEVETGILKNECEEALAGYTIQRTMGRPLVILKAAITLDGMIATDRYDSKWISSEASRRCAHQMRSEVDAVLVGVETVIQDDPELTVRHVEGTSPLRVVVDSGLRIPPDAKLLQYADKTPTLLAYSTACLQKAAAFDDKAGVSTLLCSATPDGLVDLQDLARKLGDLGILSLLVEGGGRIHGTFTRLGLADRVALFMAPRILGSGIKWVSFAGTETIADGRLLFDFETTTIGEDVLIRAKFTRE